MESVRNVEITGMGVAVFFRPGGEPGAELSYVFLSLAVPAMVLAAGCLWAAWRMANNKAVLTGSAGYRLKYFAGLYTVIVAVAYVVTALSWRGPLSMIG